MPKDTFLNLSEEKQEKVIRSAISEFMKHGYEKGNVGDIAKNAGIAKGSIYQYFENKKELFIYSVHWAINLFIKKYENYFDSQELTVFDYVYQSTQQILKLLREDKELTIFIQDVFLGKYSSLTDESLKVMIKASDEYVLKLIREGKKNGSIRTDIDDENLAMFLIGTSLKMKENILNKARTAGADIIEDKGYEMIEGDIKTMFELLKNGMGAK